MDALEFIKEFQRLITTTPQISHWTRASENCDYGDIVVVSRNCYMCFWSSNLENCFYCHESRKDRFCTDCKNCFWCFDSYLCEDSMYIFDANLERGTKDCLDCGPVANTLERCYDMAFCGYMFNCNHCYWNDWCYDSQWLINTWEMKYYYGCTYLKHKEYMFLNKPISKSEFQTLAPRLDKELYSLGIRDLYGLVHYKV